MNKKFDVLYVDDEQDNLDVFESTFWREYNLHLASSSKEAFSILQKQKIHLIVTDQRMPEMTGVELLEKVVEKYPETQRMILTGYSDADAIVDSINKGKVFEFVAKPWKKENLKQSLNNALESYRLREENQLMLQQLQLSNKKLEDFNHNLEVKVEERTQEIKKKNEELNQSVSKLKSLQTQLIQSEKLASLGMLSAVLGHEINNPIAVIKQSLEIIKSSFDDSNNLIDVLVEVEENEENAIRKIQGISSNEDLTTLRNKVPQLVDYSLEGIARIAETVKSIRDFVGPNEVTFQKSFVHLGIDSTLNLLSQKLMSNKITVIKQFDPAMKEIECLPSALNQVFMNLFVNAMDAIVHVKTERALIVVETIQGSETIIVKVNDNGSGIPADSVSSIFEEFYTTKPTGKGTGLGLAIVKDIIDKHHGSIRVESKLSQGTSFVIELPINQS